MLSGVCEPNALQKGKMNRKTHRPSWASLPSIHSGEQMMHPTSARCLRLSSDHKGTVAHYPVFTYTYRELERKREGERCLMRESEHRHT